MCIKGEPASGTRRGSASIRYIHKLETYSDILIMEYKTQFSGQNNAFFRFDSIDNWSINEILLLSIVPAPVGWSDFALFWGFSKLGILLPIRYMFRSSQPKNHNAFVAKFPQLKSQRPQLQKQIYLPIYCIHFYSKINRQK